MCGCVRHCGCARDVMSGVCTCMCWCAKHINVCVSTCGVSVKEGKIK